MEGVRDPERLKGSEFAFDSFSNGEVLYGKKKGRLPAMGWNSWNAFGSGNTEELTKQMADKIKELGLDKAGYSYVVLDDGCYRSERVDGKLVNEQVKFPSGFRALSDYIHEKGLKFGMYNDIGTNLCAGAAVGTFDHEDADAASYISWGVDFIKVDNCYYMWDNATFSNPENARFTYAPRIKGIELDEPGLKLSAVRDGKAVGEGVVFTEDFAENIGTFDGTNTGTTPVGIRSGELTFTVDSTDDIETSVTVVYATGRNASGQEPGVGEWLQIAVGNELFYDGLLEPTASKEEFKKSNPVLIKLKKGQNTIRLMNHRRQENTLNSYSELLRAFNEQKPDNDIVLSICEWGKTQPQNWGYKVGDSWRILNDITFRVGRDGDPGMGAWFDPGTPSVVSQYNKAVVMGEFAGLDKGWNDPDMLMIGMNGLTDTMCRTHMVMWCMMNSPLMLGLDLRRVEKGDWIYNIIADEDLIALNQDELGVQARRVFTTIPCEDPATDYITNHNRVDILVKPLFDGGAAVAFINVSQIRTDKGFEYNINDIPFDSFIKSDKYKVKDLGSKEEYEVSDCIIRSEALNACDSAVYRITPVK